MASTELRPMSLGELLDRTFSLYRNNFWSFVTIMLLPYLLILIFQVLFTLVSTASSPSRTSAVPSAAALGAGVSAGLLVGALYFAILAAAQAATVFAVSDLYLGRTTSAGRAYARVRGKIGRMLLVILMTGLAVGGGFVLLIIPGLIILCRTAVAIPAAMLEDVKARQALSRSFELTKGYAFQIFLVFIMVVILSWIAGSIFQFPLLLTMGSLKHGQAPPVGLSILSHFGSFISGVLVGPIATIAFALIYYDLRVRKEAFDLEVLMASLGPVGAPGTPSPA